MNFSCLHPRDQIVATMERIYRRNMTTTSGGNISIHDENGDKWITPARVDKGNLRRQDIVRIGRDGACEGLHPPSSENPFHLSIYAARPDVRAIIHAHPGALVSFSICGQTPDTRVFPEARNVCGKVAFARYEVPGSRQLGARIAAEFASEGEPNCVVLENHGVVVGGRDLADAFQRFETLEFTAQTIINARQLGEVHYLNDKQIELSNSERNLLPQGEPRSMTSREKELRKEISDFVHRAYEHRLMTSIWGSFSARIEGSSFVITPSHADRQDILPSDLVAVHGGGYVPGQEPSRAAWLHSAIYERYPEIQAVVNALPVFVTAFCVSDFLLDTRTIPESYLFLKDVGTVAFEHQFGDGAEVAKAVTPANPVALLRHNGVMIAGRTILDAFDRLEVLEATAAAIIQSRPLGPISPMSDEVTRDLLAAFPGL
ncbi:MAG TPA: class II aldolase/adducin family protein [Terrimicrobiaceae bacterium]